MEITSRFKAQAKNWILKNPYPLSEDEPSVINLDEARELLNGTDPDIDESMATTLIRSDLCRDGADGYKPTGLMGAKSILQGFGRQCDHPSKWWVYHDYSWVKAPHAPLVRQGHSGKPCPRPMPPGEWHPNMLATCKEYPTQQKKAYPGPFSMRRVAALVGDPKPGSPASASGSCSASLKTFTSGAIAATTVTPANTDSDPDGIHSRGPIKPYSLRG